MPWETETNLLEPISKTTSKNSKPVKLFFLWHEPLVDKQRLILHGIKAISTTAQDENEY